MQFLNPTVKLVRQDPGVDGMLRHIELAGRVSYKSEDKITGDSYVKFIDMLKKRGHTSPLEHGSVYLSLPVSETGLIDGFERNPYSFTASSDATSVQVVTNYRVIQESFSDDVLGYWDDGVKETLPRLTFDIQCSRAVSHELVRHRVFSFTQESTRYCDYSKDKFDSRLSFIIPSWIDDLQDGDTFTVADIETPVIVKTLLEGKRSEKTMMLVSNHICAENVYMQLLEQGCTPQQARDTLPNGLKTEVMMTGTLEQWKGFLELRSPSYGATGAHPDMAVVANDIHEVLQEFGYLPKVTENDKDN